MMKFNITCYEIGTHFITVFSPDLAGVLDLAGKLYPEFIRINPELAYIQQVRFEHEARDPKIYHRTGPANDLHPDGFRHFHVRYGREVTEQDIAQLHAIIQTIVDIPDGITDSVTDGINDYIPVIYQNDTLYPPDDFDEYLTFIRETKEKP